MKTIKTVLTLSMLFLMACEMMPRNTLKDCELQCKDNPKAKACLIFCDCIHEKGHTLDSCLAVYDQAPADSVKKKIK